MYREREEMLADARPHKELVEDFISSLDLSDNTVVSYGGMLRRYVNYLEQNHIEKPKESDLVKYKKYIKANNGHSATTQKYVVILRKFYKWCERRGYYPNVSSDLTGEKIVPTFKREPLTVEQVQDLLGKAKRRAKKSIVNLRDYAIVDLIVKTGLRTIEVSRADVEDMVTLKGINYLYVQGKGHDDKDDAIKVPDSVWELMHEYLEKRDSDSEALFINHGSHNCHGRISPKNVSLSVKNLLRLIGLDDKRYTAHSLRHTCATIALNNPPILNQQIKARLKVMLSLITEIVARESGEPDYLLNKPDMEVEHIWSNHYGEHSDEFVTEVDFANARNTIGDLLVLPRSFNASYNDDPYETKVVQYFSQNILAQSLNAKKYENNPGFTKFAKESGLNFKSYERFKKDQITERTDLYRSILEWNFKN